MKEAGSFLPTPIRPSSWKMSCHFPWCTKPFGKEEVNWSKQLRALSPRRGSSCFQTWRVHQICCLNAGSTHPAQFANAQACANRLVSKETSSPQGARMPFKNPQTQFNLNLTWFLQKKIICLVISSYHMPCFPWMCLLISLVYTMPAGTSN